MLVMQGSQDSDKKQSPATARGHANTQDCKAMGGSLRPAAREEVQDCEPTIILDTDEELEEETEVMSEDSESCEASSECEEGEGDGDD
jgi:hypothetical protein